MGHTRLGALPKTHSWPQVVAFFQVDEAPAADREFVSAVAARTLAAAEGGLTRAPDDPGLTYSFYLLARIAQAAGSEHWRPELRAVGISLSPNATAYDLATEYQTAVDEYLEQKGRTHGRRRNSTGSGRRSLAISGAHPGSVSVRREQ
jgi:hypothetical protein